MINFEELKNLKAQENRDNLFQKIAAFETYVQAEKWLRVKIVNYANKFGDDPEDVFASMKADKRLCGFFAKDPLKQNFCETAVADYLKERITNFTRLPNQGPEAYCFENGVLKKGTDDNFSVRPKTIDFKLVHANMTFFCTHKYINEEGGAQDNQYRDVMSFLSAAKTFMTNSEKLHIGFIAICDGTFFERRDRRIFLETTYANEDIIICRHDEVEDKLRAWELKASNPNQM